MVVRPLSTDSKEVEVEGLVMLGPQNHKPTSSTFFVDKKNSPYGFMNCFLILKLINRFNASQTLGGKVVLALGCCFGVCARVTCVWLMVVPLFCRFLGWFSANQENKSDWFPSSSRQ